MKIKLSLLAGTLFAIAGVAKAGSVELAPKERAPPSITDNDHWYFNLGMPGWMAFMSGDIGLHSFTSNVNVDFGQIITHVAGIASVTN